MARSQSLQSLSSSRNNRLQVDANIGQPLVTPMNTLGGQYSVAVQDTPRTNQLLQFASAINQAPVLAGQYNNIMREEGIKQAALVENENVLEALKTQDKDTWLTYQRNKAYREVLLKRGINQFMLPRLEDTEALKPDADVYQSEQDFIDRGVNPFLKTVWGEFVEKVGEDVGTSMEAQILYNTLGDEYRSNMLDSYRKDQERVIVDGYSIESADLLNSIAGTGSITPEVINTYVSQVDYLGESYNLDNKTRATVIKSVLSGQASQLIEQKQFRKASELVDALAVVKTGKHKTFGTPEDRVLLAKYQSAINDGIDLVEKQDSEVFTNKAIAVAGDFLSGNANPVEDGNTANSTFELFYDSIKEIGYTDPESEAINLYNSMFSEEANRDPSGYFVNTMLRNVASKSGDVGNLYFEAFTSINRGVYLEAQRQIQVANLSPENKEKEWNLALNKLNSFPTTENLEELFRLGDRLGPKYKSRADELKPTYNYIQSDNWKYRERIYTRSLDRFFDNLMAKTSISANKIDEVTSSLELYQQEFENFFISDQFNREVFNYAQELSDAGKTPEEIEKGVNDYITQYTENSKNLLKARLDLETATKEEITPRTVEGIEKLTPSKSGIFQKKYETLNEGSYSIELVRRDQQQMIANGDHNDLALSVFTSGRLLTPSKGLFNRTDVETVLDKTELDVSDFSMYSDQDNLDQHFASMIGVLNKLSSTEDNKTPLTAQELELIKDMRVLGISNINDLNKIYIFQSDFFIGEE